MRTSVSRHPYVFFKFILGTMGVNLIESAIKVHKCEYALVILDCLTYTVYNHVYNFPVFVKCLQRIFCQ